MGGGYSKSEFEAGMRRAREETRREMIEHFEGSDDESEKLPNELSQLAIHRSKWQRGKALGRGTFSSVFEGTYREHTKTIPVAIKTVPLQVLLSADEQDVSVFLNEIDIIKKITQRSHRHQANPASVIGIFGLTIHRHRSNGIHSGSLIMERAKCTLESFLGYEGKANLDVLQKYRFALSIAEGLATVHGARIVHRDLKDSNILLVNDERGNLHAKISDFGVSYAKQTMTATTTRRTSHKAEPEEKVGTELWQAPELICFGQRHDFNSDIYSLGLIFWRILSGGERLFLDADPAQAKQEGRLPRNANGIQRLYNRAYTPGKPAVLKGQDTHLLEDLWEVTRACLQHTHGEDSSDNVKLIPGASRPTADMVVKILKTHVTKIEDFYATKTRMLCQ